MESNPDNVLKNIPDFDEFVMLSSEIASLMYRKLVLESKIKEGESLVFKTMNTDEKYFQGGKPPSSVYIENTFKFSGINGELIPIRGELAKIISELEGSKIRMDIYKTMVEVWRTLCSNQRSAGI